MDDQQTIQEEYVPSDLVKLVLEFLIEAVINPK